MAIKQCVIDLFWGTNSIWSETMRRFCGIYRGTVLRALLRASGQLLGKTQVSQANVRVRQCWAQLLCRDLGFWEYPV